MIWFNIGNSAFWISHYLFQRIRSRCAFCSLPLPLRASRRTRWLRRCVNGKKFWLCANCNYTIEQATKKILDSAEKEGLL
jgi:Zn-finger protein